MFSTTGHFASDPLFSHALVAACLLSSRPWVVVPIHMHSSVGVCMYSRILMHQKHICQSRERIRLINNYVNSAN